MFAPKFGRNCPTYADSWFTCGKTSLSGFTSHFAAWLLVVGASMLPRGKNPSAPDSLESSEEQIYLDGHWQYNPNLPVENTSLNKIGRSKMGSASTLVKCGLLQLLCAVSFLLAPYCTLKVGPSRYPTIPSNPYHI